MPPGDGRRPWRADGHGRGRQRAARPRRPEHDRPRAAARVPGARPAVRRVRDLRPRRARVRADAVGDRDVGERGRRRRARVRRPDAPAAVRDGRARTGSPRSCATSSVPAPPTSPPSAESLPAVAQHYRVEPGPDDDPDVGRPVDVPAVAGRRRAPAARSRSASSTGCTSWASRRGCPSTAIAEGVYYGIRVNGRLVAAAGTHVDQPRRAGSPSSATCSRTATTAAAGYAKAVTARRDAGAAAVLRPGRAQRPGRQPARDRRLPAARLPGALPVRGAPRPPRDRRAWPDLTAPFRRLFGRAPGQPTIAAPPRPGPPRQSADGPSRRAADGRPAPPRTRHDRTASLVPHDVTDLALADEGVRRIEWAEREMPVLRLIRERFEREQPLAGLRIGACLHVTTETANLMRTLEAGGAEVHLAASNPLSTQDGRAAALVAELRHRDLRAAGRGPRHLLRPPADASPTSTRQITMDDGCDLVSLLHKERRDQLPEVLAGTEETTTGVIRLRAMAADGALAFPVVAVNEAETKHLFDNRYGTGQSTIDGLLRATNLLLAGRNVVIAGYGWVGRGIARRMDGHGAHVAVIEVEPGPRHRGADGRLPGHDRGRGGAVGRRVRDRDRQRQRVPARALRVDEGRRDHGQLRPLRRGAGPAGAARDGRGPRPRGARRTSRSSTSAASGSTSSRRAGSSTSARPRAIRRR